MNTTLNAYAIKWAVIAPFNSNNEFNKNYKSALKKAGFQETIGGLFVCHFNSQNEKSVERVKKSIATFRTKIDAYQNPKAIFSFIITDKQFGLIGTKKALELKDKKGWVGLPIDKDGEKVVPVTYNQMYAHGAIVLRGSQAQNQIGLTFNRETYNRTF